MHIKEFIVQIRTYIIVGIRRQAYAADTVSHRVVGVGA